MARVVFVMVMIFRRILFIRAVLWRLSCPTETPQYAFADYGEFNKQFTAGTIPSGSVVVAGKDFGCGLSREQAASCLKGADLVVVARHFARIFLAELD